MEVDLETAYRLVIPIDGTERKINVFMKNKYERDRFIALARDRGLTVTYKNLVDLLTCAEAAERVNEVIKSLNSE
jgi:hypothetical protein